MSVKQQQDSFLDRQKQKETERQALDAFQLGERLLTQALEHAHAHGLEHFKIDTHPQISFKYGKADRDPEQELQSLYSAAIAHFSDAISLYMTRIYFYFARARVYFLCYEFHRYVFDLSIALHVDEQNYALYVARAHGFWKLGKFREAILDMDFAIQKALALQEEFRTQRKKALYQGEKYVKGASGPGNAAQQAQLSYSTQYYTYQTPQISNVTLADLYYRRGVCKYDLHQWNESIADFTKCIQLQETHVNAYARRGAAYMKNGKKEGNLGVADLRKSVQTISSDTLVHLRYYKLGYALLEIGSNYQAVDAFSAAIDAAQNYLNERKTRRRRKTSYSDTKTYYKQVTLNWYDGLRFRIMDFDAPETSELYDEQIMTSDDTFDKKSYPEFYAARGKAKALLGHHQDALADFSTSIQQDDNNAYTYFERSAAKRIMGEYDEALADIEFCARRRLNSDIAYYKAIILENYGKIDQSLELYESILKGVFYRQFNVQFLYEFAEDVSVIDEVQRQALLNEEFQTEKIGCAHLNSLFHASLLHRVKLNFPRAIFLMLKAIEIENDDDRFFDILAMLYYDTLNYDEAIHYVEKSIVIQSKKPTGVNWETYYIKAVCEMQQKMYNSALEDLLLSQYRPGGGMKEKFLPYKKAEADKVFYWLSWLPPGSPLATAYHITNNIESIPRDPLSPSSAARNDQNQLLFPLLDLYGAFPGYYNHFVNMKKAECLYYIGDFVGCVRCISRTLDDFDFNKHTKRGVRLLTNAQLLIRASKALKTPAEFYNKQNETEWLSAQVETPLTESDRSYLQGLYFLRARALYQLNRFGHALKDCGRAYYIVYKPQYEKSRISTPLGAGAILFLMAKLYAHLRLYTKSYHAARDALAAGVPYFAVFRAFYMQGVALVYQRRLRLAQRCFSLALRAHFTARMARRINERADYNGIIQLPALEEIAVYLQANPAEITALALDIPRCTDLIDQKHQLLAGGQAAAAGKRAGGSVAVKTPTESGARNGAVDTYIDAPRLKQLKQQFENAQINHLAYNIKPFDDFILMQNKDVQPVSTMPNQLLSLISLPRVWLCAENAFIMHERAKTFQLMGLNELACDDFTALIRLQPYNPRLYFRRAFSLKKLGLFEYAAIDLMMAQKLHPDNHDFRIDFERLDDDFLEICAPGNEEFYVLPSALAEAKAQQKTYGVGYYSSKDANGLRKFKYYYDVYDTLDNVVDKREWTFYSLKDIQQLYDEVDAVYSAQGAEEDDSDQDSAQQQNAWANAANDALNERVDESYDGYPENGA